MLRSRVLLLAKLLLVDSTYHPHFVPIVVRAQKGVFIVDCVLRLMGGADRLQGGGGDVGREKRAPAAVECNPFLWQSNNAGLVDQKVSGILCLHQFSVFLWGGRQTPTQGVGPGVGAA